MPKNVRQNLSDSYENPIHDRLLECRREFMSYFRHRLGRSEDAEDVFQDFCIKVLRSTGQLEDAAKTDAWLHSILRNTLVDYYRRHAARLKCDEAFRREPRPLAVVPGPLLDAALSCRCIRDGLVSLRRDYADILRRVDLNDEPRSQIADDLGISANNVNVRLHRARQALKAEIEQHCIICANGRFAECEC